MTPPKNSKIRKLTPGELTYVRDLLARQDVIEAELRAVRILLLGGDASLMVDAQAGVIRKKEE